MNTKTNQTYTEFLNVVLKEASDVAKRSFGKVVGSTKKDDNNQVLTETDLEIGKLLTLRIRENYPTYNIIDEEAGEIFQQSKLTWVIDPIDGTSNFADGVPTYGIMLGLLDDNVPVAGGVALPAFDSIYTAEKGKGAFKNGEKIHVTSETDPLKTLVAYGIDAHQEEPQKTLDESKLLGKLVLNIRNLRASGSVFDGMMVAEGKYGAYFCQTSRIWDNVAQHIIIEEAGGVFNDYYGNPVDYSKTKNNFTFALGAKAIVKKLQQILE